MIMNRQLKTLAALLLLSLPLQAQQFETASEAIANMGVGWNLGNTLDAHSGEAMSDIVKSETYWGQPVTQPALMQMMKWAGFGAIRVPVTWYPHMDAQGRVDAAWMKRVHEVVDYVLNTGMYCILNVHHDTGEGNTHWLHASMSEYNANKARFEGLWRQIAEEFRDYDQRLLFEGYNEMLDKYDSWCFASFNSPNKYNAADAADAYEAINSYAQSFVNTVRATGAGNAQRNLVVNTYGACCGSGTWNAHLKEPLEQMLLPRDEAQNHLLFQIHTYPNVKNLSNMRAEMDGMFSALRTHLADKGAPVIIGEWGTANDGENDYLVRRDNVLSYADYMVKKAKDYGFATFWWMGISDGSARSLPAFSQLDLARTILQAYHGTSHNPHLRTTDDYNITYTVNYTGQWQELNLCDYDVSMSSYKGIRLELLDVPQSGYLSIKAYGATDGKEQYMTVPQQLTTTLNFNATTLGTKARRITLQYSKTGNYSIGVKSATLIKKDGTEETTALTPFWGCTTDVKATLKPTGITAPRIDITDSAASAESSAHVYTLSGQRVSAPIHPGIYISGGHRFVVK